MLKSLYHIAFWKVAVIRHEIRNNKLLKIKKLQEGDELIRETTKKIKESYEFKKDNISNLPKI